jgi:hypothetical protein
MDCDSVVLKEKVPADSPGRMLKERSQLDME